LVRVLTAEIRSRGEIPFLHAATTNVDAIGLYESLGFVTRREVTFRVVRVADGIAP
jgi:predicted GNAT family acetyltransferase